MVGPGAPLSRLLTAPQVSLTSVRRLGWSFGRPGSAWSSPPASFFFIPPLSSFTSTLIVRFVCRLLVAFLPDVFAGVQVVTTADGERPTRENSEPLHRPSDVSEEDWEDGNGRGSVVWFNQASMFQTSETGYETLETARRKGHSGNADGKKFLSKDGVFPRC